MRVQNKTTKILLVSALIALSTTVNAGSIGKEVKKAFDGIGAFAGNTIEAIGDFINPPTLKDLFNRDVNKATNIFFGEIKEETPEEIVPYLSALGRTIVKILK